MIRRRLLLGAVALVAALGLMDAMAWAQERPPTLPMRDVDVTYVVPTPGGAARQRLRFSALRQKLRIDPPGGGPAAGAGL